MENKKDNFFNVSELPLNKEEEFFEIIKKGKGHFKIERIVSTGQTTPENQWYDQETDEWVVLLQGEAKILFESTEKQSISTLNKGDHLFIKAHVKHRVIYTSIDPCCIWLAIHGDMSD